MSSTLAYVYAAKVFITSPSLAQKVVTILGFNVFKFFIGGSEVRYNFKAIMPAKTTPRQKTKITETKRKSGLSTVILLEDFLFLFFGML